jgi:glutamyl/glutaminyl-tRNA synthetase
MSNQSIKDRVRERHEKLLQNLAKDFSLDGINKAPARFNKKKLMDINSQFIRMMGLEEFVLRSQAVKDGLQLSDSLPTDEDSPFCYKLEMSHRGETEEPEADQDIITSYCAYLLDKNRISILSEFGTESKCILDWQQPELEDVKWRKSSMQDSLSNLVEIRDFILSKYDENPHQFPTRIDQVEFYMKKSGAWWEETIKAWLGTMEYQAGDYLWPLRVTLSGQTKSPSPFEILAAIDKEETHLRINTVYNSSLPK